MITAIEDVTVREGINPRDSYLVGGGGATACHIAEMARVLGIRQFMVPKSAAALSAHGGLISDIRWEAVASLHTNSRHFQADAVSALLAGLRQRCLSFLARAGVKPGDRAFRYAFLGRYQYQSWEIEVPFEPTDGGLREADVPGLCEAFHQMHERIYSIKDPGDTVEFVTWKVTAIGSDPGLAGGLTAAAGKGSAGIVVKSRRPVYIRDLGGLVEVPVYDGNAMGEGAAVDGPAVIEEETTTLLLLPGMTARTDARGNYLVEA
jgi:N-methylhydantoinase A